MRSRRVERQIDDALLATATWAAFTYLRRRTRRVLSQAAIGAGVSVGLGAVTTAGAVLAWMRSRRQA